MVGIVVSYRCLERRLIPDIKIACLEDISASAMTVVQVDDIRQRSDLIDGQKCPKSTKDQSNET